MARFPPVFKIAIQKHSINASIDIHVDIWVFDL